MDTMKKISFALICIGIFIPIGLTAQSGISMLEKEQLLISFLNIPDGEATLIQTEEGDNFLINTGSVYSTNDLVKQLKELHVKKINSIILTKHTDRYNGNISYLMDKFQVETVITSAKTENLIPLIDDDKTKIWKKNEDYSLSNHLTFYVHDTSDQGEMTVTIEYGNNSILYMGFSERSKVKSIVEHTMHKPDIIKIPDFAQGNSPSEKLLKALDPHISIIFNVRSGKLNKSLIERLNESWIDVYQLKQVGTTIIQMTLHDYEIIS
ncbi:hypothetical protein BN1058_00939 [Paraliobacillus sp. PM-2]|uniref:ComEC/Rec2 family competence protein n=1 Tax=Paraliobacillus sp. PM-2 TaxID=1462524 RepID=UPI00061CA7D3|nr:hypothetical protein [Paraliobacillus sp. PM-2]CQR46667.1 hypothetical protein BN1058_00939 [Paraliobacillus sp. PM-2]